MEADRKTERDRQRPRDLRQETCERHGRSTLPLDSREAARRVGAMRVRIRALRSGERGRSRHRKGCGQRPDRAHRP
eukprot:2239529-Rhodomonas_salina.2